MIYCLVLNAVLETLSHICKLLACFEKAHQEIFILIFDSPSFRNFIEHVFKNMRCSSRIPVVTDMFTEFTTSPKTHVAKLVRGLTFI
jgi:hypothetical protein